MELLDRDVQRLELMSRAAAAKAFARENFAAHYRYAMVLHTDQAHPHVHLVVKCEHEYKPGKRLYIRKAALQQWRGQFAEAIRAQAAYEALPDDQKIQQRPPPESRFIRRKVEQVAKEIQAGALAP